jgi:hypothetical protein
VVPTVTVVDVPACLLAGSGWRCLVDVVVDVPAEQDARTRTDEIRTSKEIFQRRGTSLAFVLFRIIRGLSTKLLTKFVTVDACQDTTCQSTCRPGVDQRWYGIRLRLLHELQRFIYLPSMHERHAWSCDTTSSTAAQLTPRGLRAVLPEGEQLMTNDLMTLRHLVALV